MTSGPALSSLSSLVSLVLSHSVEFTMVNDSLVFTHTVPAEVHKRRNGFPFSPGVSGKNQLVHVDSSHCSQGDQCNPGHDAIWRPGLLRLWLTVLTKTRALGEVHQKLCVTTQIKSSVLHVPVQVALDYSSFWGLLCYPCSTAKNYSWVQQPWPYFLTLISDQIIVQWLVVVVVVLFLFYLIQCFACIYVCVPRVCLVLLKTTRCLNRCASCPQTSAECRLLLMWIC